MAPQNAQSNRVESYGHKLEQYTPEANPEFVPGTRVYRSPDPRLSEAGVESTISKDQSIFASTCNDGIKKVIERINESPDALSIEYAKQKKDSPIMVGSAAIRVDGKPIHITTPFANVVATSLSRDVCTKYTAEMKTVDVGLADHETLIKRTNWETTLSARGIPTDPNNINREFLEFAQDLRTLERLVANRVSQDIAKSWNASECQAETMPALVSNMEMTKALSDGDVKTFTKHLISNSLVSVVKQQKLQSHEQNYLMKKYKEAHGEFPTGEYMERGMSVLWSGDKVTIKTKQFQERKAPDLSECTPAAREICEANPGVQWVRPSIVSARTGSEEFALKDDCVKPGDVVAINFMPSFIVYKTKNEVKCGLSLLWEKTAYFYRNRVDSSSRRGPAFKGCALGGADVSEGGDVQEQSREPKRIRLSSDTGEAVPPSTEDDMDEF